MASIKRTKGTISFILRQSTKEEKPISICYSFGRSKRFVYAIGYSINPKYWNKQKQRVKNIATIRISNEINDLLRKLEAELTQYVADCDAKNMPITRQMLKEHFDRYTNKKEIEKEPEKLTLLPYIIHYIDKKTKELKGGEKSQTVKSYKQTLKHLTEFQNETNFLLDFDTIDSNFNAEFIDYLNNKENKGIIGYSKNTIGKHIKSIKTFLSAAAADELHSSMKYKSLKTISEETTAIYLTMDELERMLTIDLSPQKHYELARDVFIIGCEIGQRISDYHNLRKHSIVTIKEDGGDVKYIKIKQQKTQKEVLCRITDAINEIMNRRYDGNLPPEIKEQKLNDYIKEVGKIAGINDSVKAEKTIGGKTQIAHIPKYELIMGHTARRTFCTLKYKAGIPVHDIMQLSGHSSEKEFFKYIRNPKEERVSEITRTKAFTESSITI